MSAPGRSQAPIVLAPVSTGWTAKEHIVAALGPWLQRHLPQAQGLQIVQATRPTGAGVANETLLLDVEGWPGAAQLVVRIASPDYWYIERELPLHWRLYRQFESQHEVPTPRVLAWEADPALIGQPFFVMERLPGRVPPDNPNYNFAGWLAEASPQRQRRVWQRAVSAMAAFHRASAAFGAAPFEFLSRPGRGDDGLSQALHYWRAYYDEAVGTQTHPAMEAGWSWLLANRPPPQPTQLAWGDARYGNLLFDADDRVTGLLDWDLTSLAGPESDLAWWLLMAQTNARGAGVAPLPGLGDQRDTIGLWESEVGHTARALPYHLAFAAFRLGAILIKMAEFLAQRGQSTPEREALRTDNFGTQILASMLGLPTAKAPVIHWRDLAG